jgi:hypothetical protein
VPVIYPIIFKYLVPVNYSNGTPGDFVASGSSLLLPRAAADTRGQHSTLRYTRTWASIVCYAMQGQQRGAQERTREGGTRERGKGRRKSAGQIHVGPLGDLEGRLNRIFSILVIQKKAEGIRVATNGP